MFKIIIISFLLFILQIKLLQYYNTDIINLIGESNNFAFEDTQKNVLQVIKSINDGNAKNEKRVYIFGASSMREFIPLEEELNKNYPKSTIIVGTTSGQPLIASLALIENIKISGSTIILGMTPKKYWSEDLQYIKQFYEKKGFQIKYSLNSEYLDQLYYKYFEQSVQMPSSLYVLVELFKSYLLEQLRRFKSGGHASIKLFDYTEIPQHYSNYINELSSQELKSLEEVFFNSNLKSNKYMKQNMEVNNEILKSICAIAEIKGLELVIFDIPLNYLVQELYSEQLKKYSTDMSLLNVKRVKFNNFIDNPSLFHDTSHLNKKGKKYFREYFYKGFEYAISK